MYHAMSGKETRKAAAATKRLSEHKKKSRKGAEQKQNCERAASGGRSGRERE